MNGLLMFLSLLGGVSLFGLLGIVLGPLVSAIVTGLFEAYTAPGDLISGSATKSEDRNETARDTLSVGLFMDSATVQQFPALAHTRGWVAASRQRHNTDQFSFLMSLPGTDHESYSFVEGSAMRVSRLLAVALVTSACAAPTGSERATPTEVALQEGEKKTSTDPSVNADAAAMAEFKARVDRYADLHKELARGDAKQKETADPAKINAAQTELATKVIAARADAKQGDIFTPAIRPVFRRLLAPELKGKEGRDVKAVLKDDAPAPGTVTFKVNAKYPNDQPLPTVPANLLLTLPTLPAPLEYRIVGQHLLLLDTEADLVVDYILNAIST